MVLTAIQNAFQIIKKLKLLHGWDQMGKEHRQGRHRRLAWSCSCCSSSASGSRLERWQAASPNILLVYVVNHAYSQARRLHACSPNIMLVYVVNRAYSQRSGILFCCDKVFLVNPEVTSKGFLFFFFFSQAFTRTWARFKVQNQC
jgi:hypothetical protein